MKTYLSDIRHIDKFIGVKFFCNGKEMTWRYEEALLKSGYFDESCNQASIGKNVVNFIKEST